ncbi:MAG: helix-turn-helix domain-containing protein, partial [Oscillospiraceae bacterium]|nr:helix-turn-helix domain-containing protein [Oscillospiraceae bacterium]
MEARESLLSLRTRLELTQDELAAKLHVTRQAVSRWETGETIPSTDTL